MQLSLLKPQVPQFFARAASFLDQRIFKLLEIGGRVATEATP
jgi:hypothetical protein